MRKQSKLALTFILALTLTTSSFANNPRADSLAKVVSKPTKDIAYIRAVEQYVWYLVNSLNNIERADSLLKSTEKIAIQLQDYGGLVMIYFYQGLISYRQAKAEESLKSYQKALSIINQQKLHPKYKQRILAGIGYYYVNKFDAGNALKYALEAIELTEKHHLKDYIAPAYLIAAQMYKQIDKGKSEYFYKKSLEKAYEDSDSTQRYLAENTMAGYYLERSNPKEALKHAEKSMFWVEKFGRKGNFSMAWSLLAEVNIELKNYKEAKYYSEKSLQLAKEIKDFNRMADAYMTLGYYYYFHKNYNIAIDNFRKTIELCKKMENTYGVYACYESLTVVYEEKKDFKNALNFKRKAQVLKDSLFSKDWALKLNKLEIEKKETNLKLLQSENKNTTLQRNSLIIGGVLLFVLSLLTIYLILNKSKYKRLEEQQNLRNRLASDLHDEIGSTLSSISILSEIVAYQQQKGTAKPEIMQQVSQDAREVIDKMDDIIWTINPQNDLVQNLETRLKSFAIPLFESKGIEFEFRFSPEVEQQRIDISRRRDIYLILKEAINNLIKYSQCQTALIDAHLDGKNLIFKVSDDGKGFDTQADSARNGQRNMKMRAEKIGADLSVDSTLGKGTTIKVSLKV